MKFAVYWTHKTGFPPVLIFGPFERKTQQLAEKAVDGIVPHEHRRFCKVTEVVEKKGRKR